jgi:uridine phosphorylase
VSDFPLTDDDLHEPGLFTAAQIHQPQANVPPAAVLCFFNDVLRELVAEGTLTPVYTLRSEIGANPVYRWDHPVGPVTVVHPGVGAPLAAGFLEETLALGVRTVVACGGAGALTDVALGHVLVVSSAVRDEGTSFHYAPPSRTIDADPRGVATLEEVLTEAGLPYDVGRTWTTDGLFRETRSRIERRRAEGCLTVEMEAAAFLAVARFHGVRFAQLLYAGDTLAGETWDSRHWDKASSTRRQLLDVAARAAVRLDAL